MSFLLDAAEEFPIGTRIRHKKEAVKPDHLKYGTVVSAEEYRASGRSTFRGGAFRGSAKSEVYLAIRWDGIDAIGCQSPNRIEKVELTPLEEAAKKYPIGAVIYLPHKKAEQHKWAEVISAEKYNKERTDYKTGKRECLDGAYLNVARGEVFLALKYLANETIGNCGANKPQRFQWKNDAA